MIHASPNKDEAQPRDPTSITTDDGLKVISESHPGHISLTSKDDSVLSSNDSDVEGFKIKPYPDYYSSSVSLLSVVRQSSSS